MMEEIERVLNEKVRPQLEEHDGDIMPISYQDGVFTFRLIGGCAGCPSADITAKDIIEKELKATITGLKRVVLENGVSDDLYQLAKDLLKHDN